MNYMKEQHNNWKKEEKKQKELQKIHSNCLGDIDCSTKFLHLSIKQNKNNQIRTYPKNSETRIFQAEHAHELKVSADNIY